MVSFTSIPAVYKNPLVWIEVDPSQAGTPYTLKFALLADYKITAGTAPADTIVAIASPADARIKFGDGSPLARMFERFFALNRGTPVFCLPLTPPVAGVQATGTIQVTTPPTASGVVSIYIAGQKVAVAVASTDAVAAVATKLNAAINLVTTLPVTSTVATDTVTLTAKWKGLTGNDIRIEDSILGQNGGEQLPAGLTLTYSAGNVLGSGAGTPTWSTALTQIQDEPYKFLITSHTDSGTLIALDTEYGFTDSGRWGWQRQSYGTAFTAKRDTYSNLAVWGPTQNSPVISTLAVDVKSPSPIWEWAAAYGSRAAQGFSAGGGGAARPLQTLEFDGVRPAPIGFRFSLPNLNTLAQSGLATQTTSPSGKPMIMREQQHYQKNSYGLADNAYELATTLHTLDEILTRLRQMVTSTFPRHKLANDGTKFGPGQAIATPDGIKAVLVAHYAQLEYEGLAENTEAFTEHLIVERDNSDPNRANCLYGPDS